MKKATGKTKAITNKGKAKAATGKKKVSTAKTAKSGPKPAVMNRRKYNEAISGDTMNGSSMYKRGGKVTGKAKGYKSGGSFAALAPPYDKATYADKIAGAKKKK